PAVCRCGSSASGVTSGGSTRSVRPSRCSRRRLPRWSPPTRARSRGCLRPSATTTTERSRCDHAAEASPARRTIRGQDGPHRVRLHRLDSEREQQGLRNLHCGPRAHRCRAPLRLRGACRPDTRGDGSRPPLPQQGMREPRPYGAGHAKREPPAGRGDGSGERAQDALPGGTPLLRRQPLSRTLATEPDVSHLPARLQDERQRGMNGFDITDTLAPKSDQLDATDLAVSGPQTFTIKGVSKGNAEQPVEIALEEFPRVWRPGKSMRRVLAACWGVDASKYVGRKVTLFCDPTVQFGGEAIGGTRISHMSHIDGEQKVPLIVTRGRSKVFVVKPLKAAPA